MSLDGPFEMARAITRIGPFLQQKFLYLSRAVEHKLIRPGSQEDALLDHAQFDVQNLRQVLAELGRVTKPGATTACWLPTSSSFGEFFSIYWEALLNAGIIDHGIDVEQLITDLPTVSDAKEEMSCLPEKLRGRVYFNEEEPGDGSQEPE